MNLRDRLSNINLIGKTGYITGLPRYDYRNYKFKVKIIEEIRREDDITGTYIRIIPIVDFEDFLNLDLSEERVGNVLSLTKTFYRTIILDRFICLT